MPKKIVAVAVILAFTATSCIVHTARPHSPDALSRNEGLRDKPIVRVLLKSGQTLDFDSRDPARLVGNSIVRSKRVKTGGRITVAPDGDGYMVTTAKGETYRMIERPRNFNELIVGLDPVPLADVETIWTREVNGGLTALAIFGGIVGTVGVLFALVAIFKESCPFLYSYDGSDYSLEGELYSGAVFKAIERGDMLKLHRLVPVSGEYRLKIANEANETQNTNEMTLVVVDHPKDVDVYAGPDGRVRTVRRPAIRPLSAVDFDGVDFRAAVASIDGDMWGSNPFNKDPELSANWTAGLVLRFPKPAAARKAKLVVRIGNTSWADAVFGRIFGLMGSSMQPWYQKVAADPAIREKTYRFMSEQGVAFKVQVGVPGGWQDAGFFHPTGPFGIKDDVLEIDVPQTVDDTLTVRLRGGTFFWNVDSAAVDYTTDVPVHVRALTSLSAVDGAGNDVRQALMTVDEDYFSMPEPGQYALVRYAAPPPTPGLERSLFVRSRGYYTIHPTSARPPADLPTLLAIRQQPELFLKYSLLELQKMRSLAQAASAGGPTAAPGTPSREARP